MIRDSQCLVTVYAAGVAATLAVRGNVKMLTLPTMLIPNSELRAIHLHALRRELSCDYLVKCESWTFRLSIPP